MVRKALIALAVAAPSQSFAQEEAWASIGMSGKAEVFADFGSVVLSPPQQIVREFSVRKFWMKMDHTNDKTTPARETLYHLAIDCEGRRYVVLQTTAYSARGSIIASSEEPDASFTYKAITPGSLLMTARKWICDLPARIEK